ncbi:hypothetical protein EMPG_16558 [Blastomyces silverae]|uniref:Uncharacterized protein n=1 Tax=Blastomyces silverae TaxID=2060906 RepID=A0A0H1BA52_9EURO|nr:hypothetical protein EMPG_16558 [Blastomyces silverae]
MAPRFKGGTISKSQREQDKTQRGNVAGSKHGTAVEILQSCAYSPAGNLGNAEPKLPRAKSPPGVIPSSNALEEVEEPTLYYPKEKEATDRCPDSAPLLPRGPSLPEVTGQPFRAVRKVSSTPRLRDDEIIFGRNRAAAQQNSSRASSVGSAETSQEDYCPTIPKLEGIILGSPDLSLTRKGTCGTRGSGKVIVPERKVSSVQGSIEIGDVEECSSTVTPKRTPNENNTEISLPGQNLQRLSLHLPPRPPTPVEFRQRSLSHGASSQSSFFSRGRSITRARRVRNPSRRSAKCDISRGRRVPFFVPHSINSHQDHLTAPETSPDQGSNAMEEPVPAIDHPKMVPQILSGEAPQNEILSQLKALTENVADIKIEQMKINKKLEDTNTHLKEFSKELQLEKDARVRSLAAYEETINTHITQVVGELGEAVESVAVTVAKISDSTANIGSGNSKASQGHDLKWSDAVEQEASDASVRTPTSTHTILSDKCYTGPSTIHNRGKSVGTDVDKGNVGNEIGRRRSQTNPSTASWDQDQQRPSGWRGPPPSQKRGFWKRPRGGMSRRGSASGNGGGKYATPNSDGHQPPVPTALQAQEVTPPNSYTRSHMHGGYEDQSRIHPAACTPDPSATRGQAPWQQNRFPPRQSSMRHNHSFMRGGAGPSSQNCMPHRDFSPNYGSPLPQWGQGRPQPTFHHFQGSQNPGNNPPGGQWPAANPEFNNAYKPWAGVSNWYHQVNPQGNNNIRSPPS